jgi:hypothetical protein
VNRGETRDVTLPILYLVGKFFNFVGQILKIHVFECLALKSDGCRKFFDKFTKILLKKFTNYGNYSVKVSEKCYVQTFFTTLPPSSPRSPTILGK